MALNRNSYEPKKNFVPVFFGTLRFECRQADLDPDQYPFEPTPARERIDV